jgi:hypothetical protein
LYEVKDASNDDNNWGFSQVRGNQMGNGNTGNALMVSTCRFSSQVEVVDMFKVLNSTKSVLSNGGSGMTFRALYLGELLQNRNGDVSLGLIGHGLTFCIRKNFTINHQGNKVRVDGDCLYVIKLHDCFVNQ